MSSRLSFLKIATALMLCLGSFGLSVAVASLAKPGWLTNTLRIAEATTAPEATRTAPKVTPQVAAPTGQTAVASILISCVFSPTITSVTPITGCAGASVSFSAVIAPGDLPLNYGDFRLYNGLVQLIPPNPVVVAFTSVGSTSVATATFTIPANLSAGATLQMDVYVQDNGSPACSAFKQFPGAVVVPPNPVISGVTITPATVCAGQVVTLSPQTPGTTAYNFVQINYFPPPSGPFAQLPAAFGVTAPYSTTFSSTTAGVTNFGVYITDANGCSTNFPLVSPLTVSAIPAAPTVSSANNFSSCEGTATMLTANCTSGNPLWSTGATTASIMSSTATGTYPFSVSCVSTAGCSSSGVSTTATVNAKPVIAVSANPSLTICAGTSATLTASGAASYTWTSPATSGATFSPSTTGTFSVSGTSTAGCVSTTSVVISPAPATTATIAASSLSICPGESTTLTASGGTGYAWNGGPMTPAYTVSTPGTYSVTVTNSFGCTATAAATVIQKTPPTVSITGNPAICSGQSTTLTAAGANIASYTWTPGGQLTPSITVSTAGMYGVTVTGTNGCTATATPVTVVVATAPTIAIAPSSTAICAGSPIALVASGTGFDSYVWATSNTAQAVTQNVLTQNVTNFGSLTLVSYTITATNTTSGCQKIATATVQINLLPAPTFFASGNSLTACSGMPASLTAGLCTTGTNRFRITGGSLMTPLVTNGSITVMTPTTPGSYTVDAICVSAAGCESNNNPAPQVATIYALPTVAIAPTASSICVGQTGSTLLASGAVSYVWNTGAATASISATAVGPYSVTGTDARGCMNSASATVGANPSVTASIAGSLSICPGTSNVLTASGGTSYQWIGGPATAAYPVSMAGTYSVIVTNATGCTGLATATTTMNPAVTATLGVTPSQTVCQGTTITLTAGGANTYTFSPNVSGISGNTASFVPAVGSNTYSVTATNTTTGCMASTSVAVQVNPLPNPGITISPNATLCSGQSLTLTAMDATASYMWTTTNTAQPIVNATTRTQVVMNTGNQPTLSYTLSLTTPLGCTVTSTSVITVSFLAAAPNPVTSSNNFSACGGNAVMLTSGCTQGLPRFTVNGVVTNGASANLTVSTPTAPGTYTYSAVCVTPQGCISQNPSSGSATVYSLPMPSIVASKSAVCVGQTTQLTASGGVQYIWNTGSTNNPITVSDGTYSVSAIGAQGCVSTTSITIGSNPLPVATISGNLTFCAGGSVMLTAGGGVSYQWSGGSSATTPTITASTAGNYAVLVTDANGCQSSTSVTTVLNNNPVVTIGGNPGLTVCSGESVTLTAGGVFTSYVWSNGVNTSAAITPSTATAGAFPYSVTVTNTNGCTATTSTVLTVKQTPTATITPSVTAVCSGSSFSLTASGAGTYTWSTNNTAQPIANASANPQVVTATGNLTAVTYTVTVANANGCSSSATQTVLVNELPNPPTITSALSPTACELNTITLMASACTQGNNRWRVSGPMGASIVDASTYTTPSAPGAYTATALCRNPTTGCESNFTQSTVATIYALPMVVIAPTASSICVGQTASTLVASGGVSYVWSTGAATASISATATGTYTVTATGPQGCVKSTTATVGANPAVTAVITPSSSSLCVGQTTSTLTASGGVSYVWNTGAVTAAISASVTGTYTVTATNAQGCTGSTTAVVGAYPAVTATLGVTPSQTVCQGVPIMLTAGGANMYAFSPNVSGIAGNTATFTPAVGSNTYSVTVTNTTTGCYSSTSIAVLVNPLPNVVITANPSFTICSGLSTTLSVGTGLDSYTWTANGLTVYGPKVVVEYTGNLNPQYSVTATTPQGCVASSSTAVTVNLLAAAPPTVTSSNNFSACFGTSVLLTANCQQGAPRFKSGSAIVATGTIGSALTIPTATTAGVYNYTVVCVTTQGCESFQVTPASGTVYALPTPGVTPASSSVCPGFTSLLTASGGVSYVWSNGPTTPTINAGPGSYTVTATGPQGCTATATAMVTANPAATATIGGNLSICAGQSTMLTAGGGVSYQWSGGSNATSPMITVSPTVTTSYSVLVTNATGCVASTNVTVNVTANPTALISASPSFTICAGQSTTIAITQGVSYNWNTGATTQTIPVTTGGVYSATVVNSNGCSSTAMATVTVTPTPTVMIAANPGLTICSGQSATLTATPSVMGGTFAWTGFSTASGPSVTVMNTGTATSAPYTVVYTLPSGCSATANATVTISLLVAAPPVTSPTNYSSCEGTAVTLSAQCTQGFVRFKSASGNTNGTVGSPLSVMTSTMPGMYSYSVVCVNNQGCESANPTVQVATVVAKPVPMISGSLSICPGQSTVLTASGAGTNGSYQWTGGPATATYTVSTPGTYSVIVTNSTGCTALATATVTANPAVTAAIAGNLTICEGLSTVLTATGGTQYSWTGGPMTAAYTVMPTTTTAYTVLVTNAQGCTANASATVTVNPKPAAPVLGTGATTACAGTGVTLMATCATGTAQWSGASSATGNSVTTATTAGTYNYMVVCVSAAGCVGNSTAATATVIATPPAPVVSSNSNYTGCAGTGAVLSAQCGANAVRWTSSLNVVTNGATVTTGSTSGVYTYSVVCVSPTGGCVGPVVSASATVISCAQDPLTMVVPIFNCQTGDLTFRTTGGNGTTIEYQAIGVVNWTTNPNQKVDNTVGILGDPNNSGLLTLKARQSGVEVSFVFNFRSYCANPATTNQPPVAPTVANQAAVAGTAFSFVVPAFTDPENQALAYASIGSLPAGLSFNPATRTISGTPSATGTTGVTISATDPGNLSATVSFFIQVNSSVQVVNLPPTAPMLPNQSVQLGNAIAYTVPAFTDPEGQAIAYMGTISPANGMSFNPMTRVITGTPSATGVSMVTIMANDGVNTTNGTFTITVTPQTMGNQPPIVANAIPNQTGTVGVAFSYVIPANTFSDPNMDALALSASGLPAGLSLSGSTISGTPGTQGAATVTITANDGNGGTVGATFTITINPAVSGTFQMLAPTYVCPNTTGTPGVGVGSLTFRTSGGNGSPITFSAIGITGPTTTAGPYTVNVFNDSQPFILKATQNGVNVQFVFDAKAFCQTSPPPNQAPVVANAIPNQSGTVGVAFSYQIPANTFVDPENDPITYSISGLPAGLNFNSGTRTITGTPSQTATATVTLTASDQVLTTSTTFVLTINPAGGVVTPPVTPPTGFALTAPTYNCTTKAFTFNSTGGDGSTVQYQAIGITGWSATAGPYTVNPASDAGPFTLSGRQSSNPGTVVTFTWDWKATCGYARQGVETGSDLSVTVMENPTAAGEVEVLVRGADGQQLQFRMSDARGNAVSERTVEKAGAEERQTVGLGRSGGMYFLQVVTPTQSKTVKVIRQ